ncbi:hypothetical protein [Haloarcula japonica]|uniref:Uncharacterized protein n=1 Tax=Haloarcula japonica (strain ATCC 49778 / DSM 6131 / JCM 7785 / NBRC 101032 / NCIMB 13157 / TR-1) TaxID=1227453 RepID=M0LJ66_HALJT|nr:hypothetical protein [Haloarcula japonica]EMA33561.1 hypothetical protein C444_03972 [Haloarcula japonica DSM 6131]
MDAARLHHLSLLLVGVSLGLNGYVTTQANGVSVVAGAAAAVGGALLAVVSVYSLVTGAESDVETRVAMVSALGAVLAVSGTLLMLFT